MRENILFGSSLEEIVGYSRAVVMGNWCFCAGVTGSDPVTKTIPNDIQSQIENAFTTVERVLKESEFEMKDVVRVTYYVTEPGIHDILAPQFGKRFGSIRPAVTYLEVSGLAYAQLKFEVEITAIRDSFPAKVNLTPEIFSSKTQEVAKVIFENLRNTGACTMLGIAAGVFHRFPQISLLGPNTAPWLSLALVSLAAVLLIWNAALGIDLLLQKLPPKARWIWPIYLVAMVIYFFIAVSVLGALVKPAFSASAAKPFIEAPAALK